MFKKLFGWWYVWRFGWYYVFSEFVFGLYFGSVVVLNGCFGNGIDILARSKFYIFIYVVLHLLFLLVLQYQFLFCFKLNI